MALEVMYGKLREENAKEGFGNLLSVHNESAVLRDAILEELDPSEEPIDVDLTSPEAEDDFKDAAIDDAAIAVGKMTNEDVPVDPDEFIGAPMESVMQTIEKYVPDTEETVEA